MYVSVWVCVYTCLYRCCQRGPKKASDPLELESQALVHPTPDVVSGVKTLILMSEEQVLWTTESPLQMLISQINMLSYIIIQFILLEVIYGGSVISIQTLMSSVFYRISKTSQLLMKSQRTLNCQPNVKWECTKLSITPPILKPILNISTDTANYGVGWKTDA